MRGILRVKKKGLTPGDIQSAEQLGYDAGYQVGFHDGDASATKTLQDKAAGHYQDGWTAGWLAFHLDTIEWLRAIEIVHTSDLVHADTRWAKRLVRGRLEAVEQLRDALKADLAESQRYGE